MIRPKGHFVIKLVRSVCLALKTLTCTQQTDFRAIIKLFFFFFLPQTSFETGDMWRPATITDSKIQWRQKLSGASHPHWRPICWRSVWKRRCAYSLAQWDVATPAPSWSLSLLSRLCSMICICHIRQKEKTPQWEHDKSKNRPVT